MSQNKDLWQQALVILRDEIPEIQFNTWIRPLSYEQKSSNEFHVFAPNRFILDWVGSKYLARLTEIINERSAGNTINIVLLIKNVASKSKTVEKNSNAKDGVNTKANINNTASIKHESNLKSIATFANFVQGKTNQLAFVAAEQVASNPKAAYNPLFIYGGVGLGKTHLMQAIGNQILKNNPHARVVYLSSERFVTDMVTALQNNAINDFKRFYRSLDALLIDDIQFFAHKERSQEEFFHTFNALLEEGQQVVLTCDRFPKEIDGIEDRLKSRVSWGLTVHIEPPDLETRVAILLKKAMLFKVALGNKEAFFIAERIFSNVRELEGALSKIIAHSRFTGQKISLSQISDALKDLFAVQDRMVSIENIQRLVVSHYQIKMADLFSKRRSRSVARPRQVAMALTKELTNHSLPEIGASFGGRDHTTVLHAVRKVAQLCAEDASFKDIYEGLKRSLTA